MFTEGVGSPGEATEVALGCLQRSFSSVSQKPDSTLYAQTLPGTVTHKPGAISGSVLGSWGTPGWAFIPQGCTHQPGSSLSPPVKTGTARAPTGSWHVEPPTTHSAQQWQWTMAHPHPLLPGKEQLDRAPTWATSTPLAITARNLQQLVIKAV